MQLFPLTLVFFAKGGEGLLDSLLTTTEPFDRPPEVRGLLALQVVDAVEVVAFLATLLQKRTPRCDDLTLGFLGPLPTIEQQETFCVSAHQHRVLGASGRLKSAFARSLAQHPPSLDRLGKTL